MGARAMQEASYLILTALAPGSQHGYGIIADVAGISGGRVRLLAGTLYTALDRLRADGLIAVDREEIVENRLRRYYPLTQTLGWTDAWTSQPSAHAVLAQSSAGRWRLV
jgi:DNA-binding PadR family transcriptional regulator